MAFRFCSRDSYDSQYRNVFLMQYINSTNNETLKNRIEHFSQMEIEKESVINKLNSENQILKSAIENKKIVLDEINKKYNLLESDYERLKNEKTKLIKNAPSKIVLS